MGCRCCIGEPYASRNQVGNCTHVRDGRVKLGSGDFGICCEFTDVEHIFAGSWFFYSWELAANRSDLTDTRSGGDFADGVGFWSVVFVSMAEAQRSGGVRYDFYFLFFVRLLTLIK